MLKLTKIQYFKILIVYTLLAFATVCCYNFKKFFGAPRKRPFQCFDETLNKPFILMDTVPPKQLYTLGVYFPIALIAGCELLSSWATRKSLQNSRWMLKYVVKCGFVMTVFLIGLALERLFKNGAKLKMARLRPNFLTVCDPMNTDGYRCTDLQDTVFMEEYQCSSDSYPSWAVSSAFASFPSGHTSLTSYAMVFLVGYLHLLSLKLKHLKIFSSLVLLIVQMYCLLTIMFVGMSRVMDFRHHWSDVVAGFICGSSVALAVCWYLRGQLVNLDQWLNETRTDEAIEESRKAAVIGEEKEDCCAIELGSA